MNNYWLVPLLPLFCTLSAQAQFHYPGETGVLVSYFPDQPSSDFGVGLGYQVFLTRSIQLEFTGTYHPHQKRYDYNHAPYTAQVDVLQTDYILRQSIDYALFRLFRHLYINAGVGLTQRFRQVEEVTFSGIQRDSLWIENEGQSDDFDPGTYAVEEKFRLGGHVHLLAELYLSRSLTVFSRYRADFYISSREDAIVFQPAVGLRINF
ncbi:MAG: hypothetical protein AAF632_18665 [Bacteroidota bacterium]